MSLAHIFTEMFHLLLFLIIAELIRYQLWNNFISLRLKIWNWGCYYLLVMILCVVCNLVGNYFFPALLFSINCLHNLPNCGYDFCCFPATWSSDFFFFTFFLNLGLFKNYLLVTQGLFRSQETLSNKFIYGSITLDKDLISSDEHQ